MIAKTLDSLAENQKKFSQKSYKGTDLLKKSRVALI